jgi:hypothetical protein
MIFLLTLMGIETVNPPNRQGSLESTGWDQVASINGYCKKVLPVDSGYSVFLDPNRRGDLLQSFQGGG